MSPVIAAVVALALLELFGLLGFAWRAWLQRRRTGSTGFRGISGRLGSAEWVAGLGFVIALVVAVVGPVLQLSGVITPVSVLHAEWIQVAGIALAGLGIVLTVWAQLDMGESWRVGVDASETTALVQTRVFGWVRNPIYTAMLGMSLGTTIVSGQYHSLLGLLIVAIAYWRKIRIEEAALGEAFGAEYDEYRRKSWALIPVIF